MKFKYLNNKVADIVEKLGVQAPMVTTMKDEDLQTYNEAIENTINGIKNELTLTSKALSEVVKAIQGEIARRGIESKVKAQISMFDNSKLLAGPKKSEEVIEDEEGIEDEE